MIDSKQRLFHRLVAWAMAAAILSGCAATEKTSRAPPPAPPQAGFGARSQAAPESAPTAASKDARASEESPAPAADRPGLGTQWGETRASYIKSTTFYRADFDQPSALASLWYNDAEGARVQAQSEGFQRRERGAIESARGGVEVSLRDEAGRSLPGYQAGDKTFVIGEAGARYTLVLVNRTPARFEVVASIDGLDVIDGEPASFRKRGYLLTPHQTLEIEGFRTSEREVAAFRFGSVRGSYVARKGGDSRNVGVIGVALFHERGFSMWPWDAREVEQRRQANPFPGQ
jgi:hypothetical protein